MSTSQCKDWYEVLGISDTATVNDIKKAYRKMALRWHPEKNPANRKEADRRFTDIAHAYEILTNPSRREDFDRVRYFHRPSASSNSSDPRFTFRDPLTGAAYPDYYSLRRSSATPATNGENGAGGEAPETFRDPNEVFKEFFGGREPFIEAFSGVGGTVEPIGCTGIPHQFDQTVPAGFVLLDGSGGLTSPTSGKEFFPSGDSLDGVRTGFHLHGLNGESEKIGNGFSPLNGLTSPTKSSGSIRHVTTSTRIHNGSKIVTKKIVENGVETVTVEEDGKLTLKTIDGKAVDINPPMVDPLQSKPVTNNLTKHSSRTSLASKELSSITNNGTNTELNTSIDTKTQLTTKAEINVQPITSVVTNSRPDVTNRVSPKLERRKEEIESNTEDILVREKRSMEHMSQQILDPLRDFSTLRIT